MTSRFDYVRYDEVAEEQQRLFKALFLTLEGQVIAQLSGRAQALVLTKLEEAYMWVGKSIRDQQIVRGGDATDQPRRSKG